MHNQQTWTSFKLECCYGLGQYCRQENWFWFGIKLVYSATVAEFAFLGGVGTIQIANEATLT